MEESIAGSPEKAVIGMPPDGRIAGIQIEAAVEFVTVDGKVEVV